MIPDPQARLITLAREMGTVYTVLERPKQTEDIKAQRRMLQQWIAEVHAIDKALTEAVSVRPDTQGQLAQEVEEFVGWWHLHREGSISRSVNRTYDYIDRLTKRLRALLEAKVEVIKNGRRASE